MSDTIDELLRDAGARWRAEQPAPPEPTVDRLAGGRRSRSRWLLPTAAAASVAVVAAGVMLTIDDSPPDSGGRNATGGYGRGPTELLVHNGDTVRAAGLVVAAPGKPVLFCPELPTEEPGYSDEERPAPSCPEKFAIAVTGVDLDRLSDKDIEQGVRFGYANLRGIWRDRTIEVTGQGPYDPPPTEWPDPGVPCPRPPDGWADVPAPPSDEVRRYAQQHPERFGAIWISVDTEEVLVVGVTEGDLEQVRAELDPLYGGNLCVTRVDQSIADAADVADRLKRLFDDDRNGVLATGGGQPPPSIQLLVLDERMYRVLADIGFGRFTVDVVIRPLG